jgi:hypothetical protein
MAKTKEKKVDAEQLYDQSYSHDWNTTWGGDGTMNSATDSTTLEISIDPTFYINDIEYKFNEKEILDEMQSYIDSTYTSHYSKNKFQATEFIFDGGHAEGFCIGNILKYAQRYGKKGDANQGRKDLQKVIHYAIMAIHNHDLKNQ